MHGAIPSLWTMYKSALTQGTTASKRTVRIPEGEVVTVQPLDVPFSAFMPSMADYSRCKCSTHTESKKVPKLANFKKYRSTP